MTEEPQKGGTMGVGAIPSGGFGQEYPYKKNASFPEALGSSMLAAAAGLPAAAESDFAVFDDEISSAMEDFAAIEGSSGAESKSGTEGMPMMLFGAGLALTAAERAASAVAEPPVEQKEPETEAEAEEIEPDYRKLLREKIEELSEKIRNGDTEPTFRIGSQSFTEKEWDKLLERFDSAEEAIREAMREEHTKREEVAEQARSQKQEDAVKALTTPSTSVTEPSQEQGGEPVMHVIWYTEEGIFCRRSGQIEGYEWTLPLSGKEEYDKIIDFLNRTDPEADTSYAADRKFWEDFLNGKKTL